MGIRVVEVCIVVLVVLESKAKQGKDESEAKRVLVVCLSFLLHTMSSILHHRRSAELRQPQITKTKTLPYYPCCPSAHSCHRRSASSHSFVAAALNSKTIPRASTLGKSIARAGTVITRLVLGEVSGLLPVRVYVSCVEPLWGKC